MTEESWAICLKYPSMICCAKTPKKQREVISPNADNENDGRNERDSFCSGQPAVITWMAMPILEFFGWTWIRLPFHAQLRNVPGFEIVGDRYVANPRQCNHLWKRYKSKTLVRLFYIVSRTEEWFYKRIQKINRSKINWVVSDNPVFQPYQVNAEDAELGVPTGNHKVNQLMGCNQPGLVGNFVDQVITSRRRWIDLPFIQLLIPLVF